MKPFAALAFIVLSAASHAKEFPFLKSNNPSVHYRIQGDSIAKSVSLGDLACSDTTYEDGRIGHTEYCMNAVTGGWWTDRLYQFNDPDHLVMIGNNEEDTSEGENRARLTSGAICGMMLVADNFSPSDTSGRGNCALSRQRAHDLLLNADILDIARRGRTFRPVYGHREFNDRAEGAASLFVRHTDDAVFLAAFNYGQDEMHVDIPLADLGILHPIACVSELWMHADVPFSNAIPVSVPARDARVYKISLAK